MKNTAFSRDERRVQILVWFGIRVEHNNEQFASMYEIAAGIGVSPSMHLYGIIEDMVIVGDLEWRERSKSGRWSGREFMLKSGTYDKPEPRQIPLKVSGKDKGQLSLWQ